jgi:hypothetical protein
VQNFDVNDRDAQPTINGGAGDIDTGTPILPLKRDGPEALQAHKAEA